MGQGGERETKPVHQKWTDEIGLKGTPSPLPSLLSVPHSAQPVLLEKGREGGAKRASLLALVTGSLTT